MKLLVISSAFPPFAAPETAQTVFFCERFAQRGLDVHLLTTQGNRSTRPLPAGVTIHPVMPGWGWRGLLRLARFLRTIRADAVLLIYIDWIYGCHPMITFAPALARRLNKRVRFVTLLENENGLSHIVRPARFGSLATRLASFLAGPRGLDRSYGALLRDSNGIITLCEQHLRAFERAQPQIREKAEIIPAPILVQVCAEDTMGANRRHGRQVLGISERELVVIYFGYVYPLKDLETLISAFAQLPASTRLLMVGGFDAGPYVEGLRQLCRDVGAADRISWLGHCEDEAASLYLQAADLSVLPFNVGVRMNNSSFAVVAAHGLPIITTRGETLEAVFIDGENVRLCPPRDPHALLAAMLDLITDPRTRARLATGARRLAEEVFSPERVIDLMLRRLAQTG